MTEIGSARAFPLSSNSRIKAEPIPLFRLAGVTYMCVNAMKWSVQLAIPPWI